LKARRLISSPAALGDFCVNYANYEIADCCDTLLLARWRCESLILFTDNLALGVGLAAARLGEGVGWQAWAWSVGRLDRVVALR
jgi:hypothetical protein